MNDRAFSIASRETAEGFGARLPEKSGRGKMDLSGNVAGGAGVEKTTVGAWFTIVCVISVPNGWEGERAGEEGGRA